MRASNLILILLSLQLLLFSCATSMMPKLETPGPQMKRDFFRAKWIKNIDPVYETGNRPISAFAPLIQDDLLYMGDTDGNFTARILKDGRTAWNEQQDGSFVGKAYFHHPNIIYGTDEGRIYARNYLSGELSYNVDLGGDPRSRPAVHQGKIYYNLGNFRVAALDVATGKILWMYKRTVAAKQTMQKLSVPLVYQNKLYVGFADGFLVCLNLEDGSMIWEQRINLSSKFMDVQMQPLVWNDQFWISSLSGNLKVVNPASGAILFQFPYASIVTPLVWRDQLILGLVNGDVVKINSQGETLIQKSFATEHADTLISAMVFWKDNVVLATTHGQLIAINPGNLEVVQKFSLGTDVSSVFGEISATDKYLSLLSARNRLYVFE